MTPSPLAVTLLTHDTPDYEQTLILFNNQTINLHTEKHGQCVENVYICTKQVPKMCKASHFQYINDKSACLTGLS